MSSRPETSTSLSLAISVQGLTSYFSVKPNREYRVVPTKGSLLSVYLSTLSGILSIWDLTPGRVRRRVALLQVLRPLSNFSGDAWRNIRPAPADASDAPDFF